MHNCVDFLLNRLPFDHTFTVFSGRVLTHVASLNTETWTHRMSPIFSELRIVQVLFKSSVAL